MTKQEADEQIEAATDAIRATLRQLLQEGQVDRVARISGTAALTPAPVGVHAMRTDFGHPSSNMRFRARTATATSVA